MKPAEIHRQAVQRVLNSFGDQVHRNNPDLIDKLAAMTEHVFRTREALARELVEVEGILAEALGYDHDDEVGWVTGDHTPATLAMQAARKLKQHRDGPDTPLDGDGPDTPLDP